MKKTANRLLSLILALTLALSLAIPASAAELTFDLLVPYGNGPVTVSAASISLLDETTNVINYAEAKTYACTAPVTITNESNNIYCGIAKLIENDYDHMPMLWENSQKIDGEITITAPGKYIVTDEPGALGVGAPIKLYFVLEVTEGSAAPEEPAEPVTPGLSNFKKVNTYTDGQYSDVPATHTFAENAKAGYEYNIMQGYGSSFGVSSNITRLASIIIACRLHCIYNTGVNNVEKLYSGTTQEIYLAYAKANGILCDFDNVSQYATRAEFAAILSSALPDEALAPINTVVDNAIPDVTTDMTYATEIYRLYRAGILNGSDAQGTFYPTSNITRGAACAIATRMCDEALRKSVNMPTDYATLLKETANAVGNAYIDASASITACATTLRQVVESGSYDANSIAYIYYQSAIESLSSGAELCGSHAPLKEVKTLTNSAVILLQSSIPADCSVNSQAFFNAMYSGLQKALIPMQEAAPMIDALLA